MRPAVALAESLRPAVRDERVLAAVASIPRELFVGPEERDRAYENNALPIACGQTISQPLVVARMLEVLETRPGDRALDVGTGSGYHAALLSLLVGEVWTIERHAELSAQAAATIDRLELENVSFIVGDGWLGLPSEAPFDVINVAAATGDETPAALEEQLAPGGRMVAPVGGENQHLMLTRRTPNGLVRERLEGVRFVPLVRDPN
jgi:protein-L-isoaspartate(D-aspartate) O-methyltransferase